MPVSVFIERFDFLKVKSLLYFWANGPACGSPNRLSPYPCSAMGLNLAEHLMLLLPLAALHHAAERGHTEIVGQLVIAGANVQRVDLRGFTSAHLAASQGHIDVLEKLLMAGTCLLAAPRRLLSRP